MTIYVLLQAKEMVAIADKVASKLEEKKGSITEDEVGAPIS